jgi:hypothetical protein
MKKVQIKIDGVGYFLVDQEVSDHMTNLIKYIDRMERELGNHFPRDCKIKERPAEYTGDDDHAKNRGVRPDINGWDESGSRIEEYPR